MRSCHPSALIWFAVAAIFPAASPASAAPAAASILIERVTVVSPEREAPLRDAYVLLEGGRIRSVSTERPAVTKDVQVIAGRGRFLVPGLIDSHVHVGVPPGISSMTEDFGKRHAAMLAAFWRQLPRSYLYHGVTAVVDLFSPPGSAERFRSAPLAPDLVACAPLKLERGYPGGSLPAELRSRIFPYMLPEEPEAAIRLVQRVQQDGFRCVKLFFENGFGEASHLPLPSEPVVAAVRAEAGRLGLPVALHANALDMQTLALQHKPDVLAHGLWHWGASNGEPGLPEPIRRHLDAVLASGAAYQATFGVLDGLANLFDPQFLDDPALKKVVPPSLLDWYRTDEAQFFKKGLLADDPEMADPATARKIFEGVASRNERAFAYLAQHGGKILLGSDTPSAPTWADQPGLNTWRELQHMVRAGLPLRELLKAATIRNAEVFGLKDLGTIEPGKTANLLLLRADPLASVEAWNAIETVILHGEPIPRESLAVPGSSAVLIEKVTVVSPEREAPLRDAFVLLEGGKIRSIGAERPAVAPEVQVVDGRGRYLVPGLIDSHVHVGTPPGVSLKMLVSEDFAKRHGEMLAAYWRQMPRSYLYHGVTAVVDLASPPGSAERFRSAPLAPDLVSCAPLVVEDGYPAPADAELRNRLLPYVLPGDPEAAVRLVQRVRQDGYRCIKLFFEDGFGAASLWPIPSEPVATAVRAEARRLGMPVAIHANALDMQTLALRHKPDVLAHGLWHWGASKGEEGLPEPIRQHLDAVLASGVAYQATFGVLHGEANLFDPKFLDDPALKKVVPPELLAWYRTEEAQFFKKEFLDESPEMADPALARKVYAGVLSWNERPFTYLAQHGGRVVLGSDTPSGPTWTDQPGLNTWRELQHMARAGLSLPELLKAATSRNAEVFHLQDLGTIEPGKIANLLLLRADPLASVDAWNDIETVILHGEVIARETLAVPGR